MNPEEAIILERYTLGYFGFLAGYVMAVAAWAGLTVWLLVRLTTDRLAALREWINDHVVWTALGFGGLIVGLIGFRSLTLAELIVLPSAFASFFAWIPSLVSILLVTLAAHVVDPDFLQGLQAGSGRDTRGSASGKGASTQATWDSRAEIAARGGLVFVVSIAIVLIANREYWHFPLGMDPSVHVFLGQHVLHGGTPYQTVLYFHPPLRFAVSLLWSLGATFTGLPLVPFVRAIDLGVTAGTLAVTYGIGRRITGRPSGGVVAAALLLGTEYLNEMLILGPSFKTTTLLLMLLGLWMAQQKNWFWAGVFGTMAASMWLPAGVSVVGIALAALLQSTIRRGDAALKVVLGALLVVGLLAASMLALGALEDAFEQNVVSLGRLSNIDESQQGMINSTLAKISNVHIPALKWTLRGDWELVALMVTGIVTTLGSKTVRSNLLSTEVGPLFYSMVLMAGVGLVGFDGSVRDFVMLVAILTPFGAKAVSDLLARLEAAATDAGHLLRLFAEWVVIGVVLIIGGSDSFAHHRFLYSLDTVSLAEQRQMAEMLESALEPGERVQAIGNQWFNIFTENENPTSFIQWGPLALSAHDAAGWTVAEMIEEMEAQQPAIFMAYPGSPELITAEARAWLKDNYVVAGAFAPDSIQRQYIYVRRGREEIGSVFAGWPLESVAE